MTREEELSSSSDLRLINAAGTDHRAPCSVVHRDTVSIGPLTFHCEQMRVVVELTNATAVRSARFGGDAGVLQRKKQNHRYANRWSTWRTD